MGSYVSIDVLFVGLIVIVLVGVVCAWLLSGKGL